MPGLLSKKAAPTRNAEEGSEVTPEEQEQYERFVTNGMKVLYSKQALPQIIESIRGAGSPVEGLANTLVMLVMRLEDGAEQAGQQISPDVLMHGGTELLEQMVDLAEKAGLPEFDESQIESALYLALDTYRAARQQQGRLPEDQLAADMQELSRADQAGELEQIMPGIGEYAKNAPTPEQAGPTRRGV